MQSSSAQHAKSKLSRAFDWVYWILCISISLAYLGLFTAKMNSRDCLVTKSEKGYVINSDFPVFYAVGLNALKNGKEKVYDYQAQFETLNRTLAPVQVITSLRVPYPPHFYALFCALAMMPELAAYWIWVLLGLSASIWITYKLASTNELLTQNIRYFFAWSLLAIFPTYYYMAVGQTNPFILMAFALYYLTNCKGFQTASFFSFALASIKPQYGLILALMAIGEHRWKLLLLGVSITLTLLLLPALLWGFSIYSDYIAYLADYARMYQIDARPEHQVSLRWLINYFPPSISSVLSTLSLLLCLAYIFSIWQRIRQIPKLRPLGFTVSICSVLVLMPHCHLYECGLLWAGAAPSIRGFTPSSLFDLKSKPELIFHIVILSYPLIGPLAFLVDPDFASRFNVPFVITNIIAFVASFIWFETEFRNARQESQKV